jgi:hypothetical protein
MQFDTIIQEWGQAILNVVADPWVARGFSILCLFWLAAKTSYRIVKSRIDQPDDEATRLYKYMLSLLAQEDAWVLVTPGKADAISLRPSSSNVAWATLGGKSPEASCSWNSSAGWKCLLNGAEINLMLSSGQNTKLYNRAQAIAGLRTEEAKKLQINNILAGVRA